MDIGFIYIYIYIYIVFSPLSLIHNYIYIYKASKSLSYFLQENSFELTREDSDFFPTRRSASPLVVSPSAVRPSDESARLQSLQKPTATPAAANNTGADHRWRSPPPPSGSDAVSPEPGADFRRSPPSSLDRSSVAVGCKTLPPPPSGFVGSTDDGSRSAAPRPVISGKKMLSAADFGEAKVVTGEEEDPLSWAVLLYQYSQDTTLHGLPYVARNAKYLIRR